VDMVTLRKLSVDDAHDSQLITNLVRVFCDARRARLAFLMEIHDAEEDRRFLSGVMLAQNDVWIADVDGEVAGFIAFSDGWVNQLYVAPAHQCRGLGTRLLDVAKRGNDALQLWAFQANEPAITYYERRGFRIVERTDGAANEARRADVRMAWRANNATVALDARASSP
jgi:putative acetyltransferase